MTIDIRRLKRTMSITINGSGVTEAMLIAEKNKLGYSWEGFSIRSLSLKPTYGFIEFWYTLD